MTKIRTSHDVSRRSFLKGAGVAALGTAAVAGLASCGQPTVATEASSEGTSAAATSGPSFLQAPEAIVDFAETKEYDVVVVGCGESGLSAVHTALEAGASVACVQNVNGPQTTGNMAAYLDLEANGEAEIEACVSFINWKSDYRSDRKLVEVWARNSQEALTWWAQEAAEAGVETIVHDAVLPYNGYEIALHANTYFHVEGNHNAAAVAIQGTLAAEGAEFFFNTPCVQLYKEGEAVKGAICTDEAGTRIIGRVWADYGYLCDPHTACGWAAAESYRAATGDCAPMVVLSTASPYKFADAVLTGLGASVPEDAFDRMDLLQEKTGVPIPRNLASLKGQPILHRTVLDREEMLPFVLKR